MSQEPKDAPKVDAKALLAEIEKSVAQKKAQGFYDPAEISRVEQAAVSFAQPAEDGAEAELSLRHAKLQGLWDAKVCGVSSHRGGAAGSAVVRAKQLIHKLTRFFSNIWLSRQVEFNDELVKLLNVMVPHHADLRQRMPLAEKRLDDLEDLSRDFSSLITEHGRSLREAEARLAALEREAGKGAAQVETLLARLQGILDAQVESGAVSSETANAVAAERQRQRGSAYLAFEDLHRGSRAGNQENASRCTCPSSRRRWARNGPCWISAAAGANFWSWPRRPGWRPRAVDLNPEMAAHCQELGLEAEGGRRPGIPARPARRTAWEAYMAAQLIEHLTVDQLTETGEPVRGQAGSGRGAGRRDREPPVPHHLLRGLLSGS